MRFHFACIGYGHSLLFTLSDKGWPRVALTKKDGQFYAQVIELQIQNRLFYGNRQTSSKIGSKPEEQGWYRQQTTKLCV